MVADKSSKLQPKENQHLRLKLDQIRADYRDGLLNSSGLLYYAIGVMRAPGQDLVLTIAEWLQLTGLKERTFYKAKAKLVAQGKLAEKVEGSIALKYESRVIDMNNKQEEKDTDTTESSDCPIVQSSCPIVQDDCPIVQDDCPIVQDDCPIVQDEKLKHLSGIVSSIASDITNIANAPPPDPEGKGLKSFEEKEGTSQRLPDDVLAQMAKLRILGSDRDFKVMEACQNYSLAQVRGAVAHVSKTWESCNNPAAVFLYQLPKQSRARGSVKGDREKLRVPEFVPGLIPLKELHGRYGQYWEDPARHFGHSEEAIAEFKELLRCQK